ncbi:MAG: hypothetical protein M3Y87_07980 [Myxococcota bacterium]|nr:hypothetical protein [Myxococcota bacterium]
MQQRNSSVPSRRDDARRWCYHCDREVVAERSGPGWRLVAPGLVIAVFAAITAAALAGPFVLIVLVPAMLLTLAIGPSIAKLKAPPTCPRCGRETPYGTREEARAAHGWEPPPPTTFGVRT